MDSSPRPQSLRHSGTGCTLRRLATLLLGLLPAALSPGLSSALGQVATAQPTAEDGAAELVVELRFDEPGFQSPSAESGGQAWELLEGASIANVGPSLLNFEGMPARNAALVLNGKGARARLAAMGESSLLDFTNGDAITLEAWVKPEPLKSGANVYIIGKGRTYEAGPLENQNYALRLQAVGGVARVSFLFSTPANADAAPQYHRWTSDLGFAPDGGWHHVAVSYRFGTPDSIVGYVNGQRTGGKWDMAGATTAAPLVSDEPLWIGSARGGDPGNSFHGALDNVWIHRGLVPAETLTGRYRPILHPPEFPEHLAADRVTIQLHPGLASHTQWPTEAPPSEFAFTTSHLAVHRLPLKFTTGGIRAAWAGPLLLRAYCRAEFGGEELELLLRSPGLSRLWIDGEIVLTTPAHRLFPDAHQPLVVYQADDPWLRVPRISDVEVRKRMHLTAGMHDVVLEQIVGAKGLRCETGDTTVAVRRGAELFTLLGPATFQVPLSDEGWESYHLQLESELSRLDADLRREATQAEQPFWDQRHELARQALRARPAPEVPASSPGWQEHNPIDRFINARLARHHAAADAHDHLADDATFLRRVTLDTRGTLPSVEELTAFLADTAADKRQQAIERLVDDPGWADHWTSLWQDVLAENPSILKPTLNNTGPFRWWIHDALLENKPLDRFATELIRMEGARLGGGAAGFGMATENDVPMAAKAHVLTAAFLGVEMKCARCHDAPYHPWKQGELFALAAMLDNKPIQVPASSSVPKEFFSRKENASPIMLSIFPGDVIEPKWPLVDLYSEEPALELLGRDDSPRERLAAYITGPHNARFPQVIMNRLWHRLMGWGLMGELDDWYEQSPRDAELLKFLAHDFVQHGYDLKHSARLILASRAYQRPAIDGQRAERALAFTAPWVRRLSAEQVVDALHAASGLPLATEELTFDPAGQQREDAFINLGVARRAWQLISLSNERDRPSLSLPKAATVVECLEAFGWRGSRQEPSSHRETEPNMVAPGVVAYGAMSTRVSRLIEDSRFTQLALDAQTPETFVEQIFLQLLSRHPNAAESATFVELLAPGFPSRITTLARPARQPQPHRGFVDWSTHFDPKANALMRDIELEVTAGPEPTTRLVADWRERAEDAIWAVMNSPEFQFIP
jgi:hypothetical protein